MFLVVPARLSTDLAIPSPRPQSHWVLGVMYMQDKEVQYLDSLHSPGTTALHHLLRCVYVPLWLGWCAVYSTNNVHFLLHVSHALLAVRVYVCVGVWVGPHACGWGLADRAATSPTKQKTRRRRGWMQVSGEYALPPPSSHLR